MSAEAKKSSGKRTKDSYHTTLAADCRVAAAGGGSVVVSNVVSEWRQAVGKNKNTQKP